LRGTGGIYHLPGDDEVLETLTGALQERVLSGRLALLSGHADQLDPLLSMAETSVGGILDRCYFKVLLPGDLITPAEHESEWYAPGLFRPPRRATDGDMERLIDFYLHGFYSLARLPTRDAWRTRLSEQLAFRTLYLIEDREGMVASAALSSAEGGGTAMLGGVATLDSYRGLGLSTRCVGALCEGLFAAGAQSIGLFYLKDNTPAGRVYDKLGFRSDGEWLLVPMGLGIVFGG
jgi:RimJ/RimL family protein N-acetyltransferase